MCLQNEKHCCRAPCIHKLVSAYIGVTLVATAWQPRPYGWTSKGKTSEGLSLHFSVYLCHGMLVVTQGRLDLMQVCWSTVNEFELKLFWQVGFGFLVGGG